MKERSIESIKDLFKLDDIDFFDSQNEEKFIFRGESRLYKKCCVPKIFREGCGIKLAKNPQIYNDSIIRQWISKVTFLEGKQPQGTYSYMEKMILAQHYGVITQLLDWTLNPLVSIWFSVSDITNINQDGYIYVTKSYIYSLDNVDIIERYIKEIEFIQPKWLPDLRVVRQNSVMSIHPEDKPKLDAIYKIKVNSEHKKKILAELELLGINNYSLGLATRESLAQDVNKIS